jgi:tungstate transport system substrate-binding protein
MPMNRRHLLDSLFALVTAFALAPPVVPAEPAFITLASTTSTENSGLFKHLLPRFEEKSGIEVRVVAVGTGQAIEMARRGDADVILVHHRASEDEFVAHGYGVERFDVMFNDYLIVGPSSDPAKITGMKDAARALKRIAESQAVFTSRGDDSGTHKAELALWKKAGMDVKPHSGQWYRETGSGMGAMLNTASGIDAYALTDRATWASFRNRGNLELMVEGDPALFNPYGVILVNPARHPHIKRKAGQAFIDWLLSGEGQDAIAEFRIDGQQVFFPNTMRASKK